MIDVHDADAVVLGCGNVLFGDDGFGPAVIESLQRRQDLPPGSCVVNAGLAVRDFLFSIALSERRPRLLVVVDAAETGRRPGQVTLRNVEQIAALPAAATSMHLFPTSHLLRELHELREVKVVVVSVQPARCPDQVSPGLSDVVSGAVEVACEQVLAALRSG